MKSYRVSVYYSEIIEAANEDDALDKMWEIIVNGLIKRSVWEFDVESNED
jgi:hypothetical protein